MAKKIDTYNDKKRGLVIPIYLGYEVWRFLCEIMLRAAGIMYRGLSLINYPETVDNVLTSIGVALMYAQTPALLSEKPNPPIELESS